MNIRWVQGLAEDLPAVAPGPYRLVTFGQSFHWTDEQQVAETVYDMLEPGGALALIVHTVTGRPRPPDPGVPSIPHDEIKALVEKCLGSTRRAGQGTAPERTHRFEDVLARTRFGVPQQLFLPGIPGLLRDSESVLSGYLSLSSSAPHLFGDRLDDFAEEVRALLANRSADGIFWDWPGDTEVCSSIAAQGPTGPRAPWTARWSRGAVGRRRRRQLRPEGRRWPAGADLVLDPPGVLRQAPGRCDVDVCHVGPAFLGCAGRKDATGGPGSGHPGKTHSRHSFTAQRLGRRPPAGPCGDLAAVAEPELGEDSPPSPGFFSGGSCGTPWSMDPVCAAAFRKPFRLRDT